MLTPGSATAADEVIGSNLDDGVARFLEQLVAEPEPPTSRQEAVKTP